MDQFDRGSRMRLNERLARARAAGTERDRGRPRLLGYQEDDSDTRRLLIIIVAVLVLLILAVVFYVEITGPSPDSWVHTDTHAWGTPTHETTRVQPPAWWLTDLTPPG